MEVLPNYTVVLLWYPWRKIHALFETRRSCEKTMLGVLGYYERHLELIAGKNRLMKELKKSGSNTKHSCKQQEVRLRKQNLETEGCCSRR